MMPPDPPEAGEPSPEPEKLPGQPIADCLKAMEEELDADPANDPSRQEPSV